MAENEEFQLKSVKQKSTHISNKDIAHLIIQCGTFGPFQRWLYGYVLTLGIVSAMQLMNLPFLSASVPFLCYPPNFNASLIPANLTEDEYLQMLQPDSDDQCSVYNNNFTGMYYTTPPSNSSKLQCSYGRKFLTEEFSTIESEFDLVCERKWLKCTSQSVFFSGFLVGSIIHGILSDRFGRRPIILLARVCLVICGIIKSSCHLSAFFSSYIEFKALDMLLQTQRGDLHQVPGGGSAALGQEGGTQLWLSDNFCDNISPNIWPPNSPHWKSFDYYVWSALIISSESPRWLIERKRFVEAEALFRKI
ncbi:solute carrier family 22 member 7-like [Octopus sinensis]|uniref:Solute carrier family 22 member 7-like n=1 Tax=Octopus sinensis TaxID=2607531 RepID=A0A7E6FAX1_9MOLL|nr:solute carrier family 22 member 7-like [Octopus sinensis]